MAEPTTLVGRLRSTEPIPRICAASLIGLVIISNDDRWTFAFAAVACVLVLPRRRLLVHPAFWSVVAVGVAARQLAGWHTIDDHTIAMTYWCGALALGLGARDQEGTLAAAARFLIGSLFAFAAGWKLLSGQFIDGTFFRYTLLFDDRFEVVSRVIGGTSDAMRAQGVEAVSEVVVGDRSTATVLEGPRNAALATVFTWWGIVIESAVAVSFLAPLRKRWGWIRHVTLVAFAATTYLVVPVGGFGTLLLILGAAMATTEAGRTRYLLGATAMIAWAGVWPLLFQ